MTMAVFLAVPSTGPLWQSCWRTFAREAGFVRDLFQRYLALGSVVRLKMVLDAENIRLPVRVVGTGRATGGGLISRGHIYHILSNPIYAGQLSHKGQIHDGLHTKIVDLETWDRVQNQLAAQTQTRADPRRNIKSFLADNFTTIAAIGWAQAMPPRAAGVGATISHERPSRVASRTLDRCPVSRQRKSKNRSWMRSRASSRGDARSMDGVRCLKRMASGEQSARSRRRVSPKSFPFTTRWSTRSNELQSARRKSRYGSVTPLPRTVAIEH